MNIKETKNFTVKSIGVREEFVYDIEVEDAHNFFADDILVHNSVYINFEKVVEKTILKKKPNASTEDIVNFLDTLCKKKIEPYIDKSYGELYQYMNAYTQSMKMKRESIADTGIWTAKKRYILNVHDNEGVRYKDPHLKIMGIECVRSSTPEICRDRIEKALKIIMQGTQSELQSFIQDFEDIYRAFSPYDISKPCGVKGDHLYKYSDKNTIYKSGTPQHVKGSLIYNKLLKDYKLTKKHSLIKDGEKVRTLYLRDRNPIDSNIISFIDVLPEEFGLHEYIDYDMQFEKTFIKPLKTVLDTIDWTPTESDSLFDLIS